MGLEEKWNGCLHLGPATLAGLQEKRSEVFEVVSGCPAEAEPRQLRPIRNAINQSTDSVQTPWQGFPQRSRKLAAVPAAAVPAAEAAAGAQ